MALSRLIRSLPLSGRLPSKRALAAITKLHGFRLEKRWPFLIRAEGRNLNLTFEDVLEFQYARSRHFVFMSVGAFDGLVNDPVSRFVRSHDCKGILIEPQTAVYERLCANYRAFPDITLVNAAVDKVSGSREMYYIPAGNVDLPDWTEQLASFTIEHLLNHETRAPGLSARIHSQLVQTISFDDLLEKHDVQSMDVLQIDAEGMDAQLLEWFPFERLKPAVLHYETVHMPSSEHRAVRTRLEQLGYFVREADGPSDDMAVLF